MLSTNLQGVADAVVRRAQRQGFVVPRDVREELTTAGSSEELWKDVLALARASLSYRHGRYHYAPAFGDRARQEQRLQQQLRRAIRQIIRRHGTSPDGVERRRAERVSIVQPVKVRSEDGRESTCLTRDLSATGIRLVGTRRLLGKKVEVRLEGNEGEPGWCFGVRVLWTYPLGEDLFENGGTFLSITEEEPAA
jgi:hypothetical protein